MKKEIIVYSTLLVMLYMTLSTLPHITSIKDVMNITYLHSTTFNKYALSRTSLLIIFLFAIPNYLILSNIFQDIFDANGFLQMICTRIGKLSAIHHLILKVMTINLIEVVSLFLVTQCLQVLLIGKLTTTIVGLIFFIKLYLVYEVILFLYLVLHALPKSTKETICWISLMIIILLDISTTSNIITYSDSLTIELIHIGIYTTIALLQYLWIRITQKGWDIL